VEVPLSFKEAQDLFSVLCLHSALLAAISKNVLKHLLKSHPIIFFKGKILISMTTGEESIVNEYILASDQRSICNLNYLIGYKNSLFGHFFLSQSRCCGSTHRLLFQRMHGQRWPSCKQFLWRKEKGNTSIASLPLNPSTYFNENSWSALTTILHCTHQMNLQ
jgi:hypothetical protein